MSNRLDYDAKLDPFVKLIRATMKEPAWLDLSFGARSLYVLLKSYHNGKNNGDVYLGVRRAASQLNASRSSTERWFAELADHGFIVKMKGAFLGLDGKGEATRWRLTEIGYLKEQPTRDYKNWTASEKKTGIKKRTHRHDTRDTPSR